MFRDLKLLLPPKRGDIGVNNIEMPHDLHVMLAWSDPTVTQDPSVVMDSDEC